MIENKRKRKAKKSKILENENDGWQVATGNESD